MPATDYVVMSGVVDNNGDDFFLTCGGERRHAKVEVNAFQGI